MKRYPFHHMLKQLVLLMVLIIFLEGCQKNINEKAEMQSNASFDMATDASNAKGTVAIDWYKLQLRMILGANPGVPGIAINRMFSYMGISLYEAARFTIPNSVSLHSQLYQMPEMPVPDAGKKYSWVIAANAAMADITRALFPNLTTANHASIDSLENVYNASSNAEVANRSKAFGESIAAAILAWAASDKFDHASDPYTPPVFPGAWVPTPPSFAPPITPYLGNCRPFLSQHNHGTTPPTYPYSETKGSDFYKMVKRVYEVSKSRTEDQTAIALFWNDVGIGVGYTPMGHNISIINQVLEKEHASLATAIATFAKAGIAIWDASIFCFRSKYKYTLVRPVTYIRNLIDTSWIPLISTPPHPEYPAAHALVTAAVMEAISSVLGRNYAFTDHTYDFLGYKSRSYNSFNDAGRECGMSRLYGGIHYVPSIKAGNFYGHAIGKHAGDVQLTK